MKKAAVFIVLFFSSVASGSLKFSFAQIWATLLGRGEQLVTDVIFDLRLPRVLVALVIGMNLASAGALMQAVMQNPLADPGIIGVSAGASVAGDARSSSVCILGSACSFCRGDICGLFNISFSMERRVYSRTDYSIGSCNQCSFGKPYRFGYHFI